MEASSKDINSFAAFVANHVTAMLAYWDKNLVCRFANDAYIDWFGKSSEEIIGKMNIADVLGPVYLQSKPYIDGALAGIPQTYEREIITPKGEKRYSLTNYIPDIENGEVKGMFVHVADITSTKVLEHQLLQSSEIIAEQNKRLLNFANIVSHNLKAYANNFAQIIGMLNKPGYEAVRNEAISHLERLSKDFSSTIHNLTEISKVQNRSEITIQEIRLSDYVTRAIEILNLQVSSTKAFIFNKVKPEAVIWGDPAYVESILLNLISNALKYRHPDRDPQVVIESYIKDGRQGVQIKDNGLGIDLEKCGNDLFGMNKTFHGNADAQGIGLYITKYQVEQMLGKIDVKSTVGDGTCFFVDFPLKEK